MRSLCSTVTAWPSSSNIITTQAAPYFRTSRAWARNCSSPSLRLIELTIDLPCTHFKPGFEHGPVRAVDHHRHAGDVGLGGKQVEELGHHLRPVQQALVHVDVDDVRPALDLLPGDGDGLGQVAFADQPGELLRAGDVGPLADHDEGAVGADHQRFQAAERSYRAGAAADGGAACRARRRRSRGCGRASCRSSRRRCSASRCRRIRPSTAAICSGVSS